MIAPLAKCMDWSAVQAMTLMGRAYAASPRLEEAVKFLNGPDFIPAESRLARVEFNGDIQFRFATPRPCESPKNNIFHGRLSRAGDGGRKRPAIFLLPGYNAPASYRIRFPLIARR